MSNRMNFRRRHESWIHYIIRTNHDVLWAVVFAVIVALLLVRRI